jgi:hypothetical protein
MHITEPLPNDKRARLVFGLDWRAYPAKGSRAQRRRYADDFGATHYAEYKVGDELIGGFGRPDTESVKGAKLYSGAVRIAQRDFIKAAPAALVILQDDDQRAHLVYVVRGAVHADEVLSLENAARRRQEIELECQRLGVALVTLGAGRHIGAVDRAFAPSELLKDRKAGRFSKVPASLPTLVPLVMIVVAFVLGGIQLHDMLAPPPPPVRHEPSFQERYQRAQTQIFAKAPPRASELAPAVLASIGHRDSVMAGWLFDEANCGAAGRCAITFRRQGGSFADFGQVVPASMQPVRYSADGQHLSAQGPEVPKVSPVSMKDMKAWPSEQALIAVLQTPAQRLSTKPYELRSYGYKVTIDRDGAKPIISVPISERAATAKLHLLRQGSWQIDGYQWQAPLLAKLPSNMTLDSLSVTLKINEQGGTAKRADSDTALQSGVHFTAKGKYYVLD